MIFEKAFKHMVEEGQFFKLPEWDGYWYWDSDKKTIIMRCKDGTSYDIRETQNVKYTVDNMMRHDWVRAINLNTPLLGGHSIFSFKEAMEYLKKGHSIIRQKYFTKESVSLYVYKLTNEEALNNWDFCYEDIMAEDWMFYIE